LQEDLRKWFSKTDPGGDWKRINSKGEAIGPCAREPGEPKPKCMSRAKRESLTKKERASAVRAKRKHDPDPERKGSPINVSNFGKGKISEDMENLNEKNVPTNPELWSRAKSLARSKFDVYPSAYANGWASKWYKGKGGSWKSVSEESEQLEEVREVGDDPTTADYPEGLNVKKGRVVTKMTKEEKDPKEYGYEGDMAINQLKTIMRHAEYLIDMMEPDTDLPEWVQSKITLAADYIQTSCDYLTSEMDESVNESDVYGKPTTAKTPTVTLKHKTSGKEIVVTKKSAPGYKRIGYYVSEEFSKTGKEATHNKTGEKTYEYAKVDSEGRKTGEREYRNAQGKPMGEEFAGYIAHYNGQKHEIKSHEAKDLYDAKQKAIAHFKIPKAKHGLLSVKPGYNEDYESSYDEPRVRYERPIERDSRLYKKPNANQKGYNKTSTHEYFAGTYNRNVKKQKPNFEAVNYGNAYPGLGDDVVDKKKKLNPQPNLTMKPKQVKDFIDKTYKGYSEEVELDESLITGTKKISTHEAGQHKAEVRHNSEYNEFQVHYYKDGKHRGEGPVSYHENDRADATASAKREIERLGKTQKEEVEQIDELSKGLVARYANKVAKTTQANYDKSKDKFQFSSDRQDGMKNAVKRLTKEETQIDEISRDLADRYLGKVTQQQLQKHGMQPNMYDKLPKNRQQGVSNAFKRVLVKSPVKEETVEEQLYKQGRFVTGAGKKPFKAPILATPKVEESKAHKVLNTFFKNREVAQRAFTGQNKTEKPKQEPKKQKVLESRKAEIIRIL
jgi:hypothetical protein